MLEHLPRNTVLIAEGAMTVKSFGIPRSNVALPPAFPPPGHAKSPFPTMSVFIANATSWDASSLG